MIAAPKPANEAQRLASLTALDILDSSPEEDLDALVRVASKLCSVPISLLSLIDVERQWFMANVGLEGVSETPRDLAFCAHAILAEDVFEIPDATQDVRFHDNPLVVGNPDIRFYAGAQLNLSDGTCVGTLCVIDRQPRQLTATQRESLRLLAKVAARALEGRRALLAERQALAEVSQTKRALEEKNAALAESERLLERTGEVAGVGGWSINLATGKIRWTAQTARIHGMPADYQPVLERAIEFYVPEARPLIQSAVEKAISDGTPWDMELQIVRAGGELIWVRTSGQAGLEEGRAVQLWGAFQDITAVKLLGQRLTDQHERLRVTLQSIGDAVITTTAQGQIASLNPAAERLTGWLADEAAGEELGKVFHVVHAESRQPASLVSAGDLAGQDPARLPGAALLISRWGEEFGIDESISAIRTADNEMLGAVIVFRDVSEQRRRASEIQYRASHDSLTGLVNRSEFEARLERGLAAARVHHSKHVLLFIDLDRFKLVNDACGHAAGDLLLQQISKLLGRAVRSRDTLARLGGDEFAVLLNHCSPEQAQRIAQQICDAMDDFRFLFDGRRFRLGASIGMVPVDARWNSIAAAMQAADSACYAAKEAGRNQVHSWTGSGKGTIDQAHARGQWAGRLEHALDTDRFVLLAQRVEPARDHDQGLCLEVLLRMREEHGELLAPGAFLPEAQRFHLCKRIDGWVIKQTLGWLESLPHPAMVSMVSINLSPQSIVDPDFHRKTMALLALAAPAAAARLFLEIPESLVVSNLAEVISFVEKVGSFGVRTAIDDFGSDASSFGYLKSLKVDLLKIDGQFIRTMDHDCLDRAAVQHFVEVAKIKGLLTMAKSVQREELREAARAAGCDYLQGYAVHKPQSLLTVWEEFLRQSRV